MYGLVNQAIKELVCAKAGDSVWQKVRAGIGLEIDEFDGMSSYPDSLTYQLVAAVGAELNLPVQEVLRLFGKHWVIYTASEGYGDLMDLFGSDLDTCLSNLNDMHARMGLMMPNLVPPRFVSRKLEDGSTIVEYHSKRTGLAPMVTGLLEGLSEKFGIAVNIDHKPGGNGVPDLFTITRRAV